MQVENVDLAPPKAGEVRIRLAAAGVNFIDVYQRRGLYPKKLPYIPGLEGAGTIVAKAEDVSDFHLGERVAFCNVPGSYAEETNAAANTLVKIPTHLDFDCAAAVMLQGLTAHYLACSTFALTPGSVCLIHAAAGGVGQLLTQIAKLRGATVIGTVSTPQKAAAAKAAGADCVINYSEEDFLEAVREFTGGKMLDVVYDSVGKDTFQNSLRCLRARGMLVSFGQSSGPIEPFSPLLLSQHGSLYLTRPTLGHYTATREELEWRAREIFSWIAEKQLQVSIGARYSLAQASGAHQALEERKTSGKVLLLC